MKKPNLIFAALIICFLFAAVTSCHKNQNIDCQLIATGIRPIVNLQIVDSQKRDLLDPATPNHYDTAAIRQLNSKQTILYIVPNNTQSNHTGKILLMIPYSSGETTNIYSLSATDKDTVYTNETITKKGCNSFAQLTAFKYNGKSYTDTLATAHFVIVK